MCKEFVALLGCRIEAHRIVHTVIGAEGNFLVSAVDAGRWSVDQVLDGIVPAGLQDIIETDHIAFDVHIRILDTVAHPCLRGEINDYIELVLFEEFIYQPLVCYAALHELVFVFGMLVCLGGNQAQTVFLKGGVVVIIQIVQADNFHWLLALKQPQNKICSDESGRAGN